MNLLVADLQLSIPTVGTPQQIQHFSRSHHTQCPIYCSSISPLCLHLQYFLQPVAADQLYMELLNKHKRYKYNIVNIHKKRQTKKQIHNNFKIFDFAQKLQILHGALYIHLPKPFILQLLNTRYIQLPYIQTQFVVQ